MPLRLSERLLSDVAVQLGAGGRHYSARQLWYAVCAALERPHASPGAARLGCGVLVVLLAVVGGIVASLYVGLAVVPGLVLVGMGVQELREEGRRPTTRPLALGFEEFRRDYLEPARRALPERFAGLVDVDAAVLGTGHWAEVLVVCDREETAAVLAANLRAGGAEARGASAAVGGAEEGGGGRGMHPRPAVAVVAESGAAPLLASAPVVLALHDADPRGCGLPLRLVAAGATRVVDLGLRPGQVRGRRVQVIEGAPAMVPGEVGALLTPEEIVWLAEGRRVELATLTPAELVAAVDAAVAAVLAEELPPAAVEGVRLWPADLYTTDAPAPEARVAPAAG